MSEKNKKEWDEVHLAAVRQWYDSSVGFDQIDKANKFPCGTLSKLVNSIPDYKGTRGSIGRWIRRMAPAPASAVKAAQQPKKRKTRKKMKKDSLPTDQNSALRQLQQELAEANRKISRLEAQQTKDQLRRDFLEGQLEEYRKLVKPSESKKSHTK